MASNHASSGEVIDLRPLGAPLSDAQSTTLLRDEQLTVMRLVMPTGKELRDHAVDGPRLCSSSCAKAWSWVEGYAAFRS